MREQTLCLKYGLTFIKNQYGRNYAGNLNTAIDHIIRSRMIENNESINHTFIAFLDDDEVAFENWLYALDNAQQQTNAEVVFGPIEARLETGHAEPKEYFINKNHFINDFF